MPKNAAAADSNGYRDACRQIGEAIANRGWAMSVGTDREDSADLLVVEGARRVNRPTEVFVHYHDNEPVPFSHEAANHAAIDSRAVVFIHCHGPGNWVSGRIKEMKECDVVLLIGGKEKTAQAFHTATGLAKPCIPLAGFGGASGELWNVFAAAFTQSPLQPERLRQEIEPWRGESSSQALLEFADRVVRVGIPSRKASWFTLLAGVLVVTAVIGWSFIFFGSAPPGKYSFFLILLTTSVMGAGLHWLMTIVSGAELPETAKVSWARAGAAVILALGLFLLFLLGGVAINGDVSFLEGLKDQTDFMRLAAVSSLFGFAAGFMTETVSRTFAERIKPFIDGSAGGTSSGDGPG